MNRAVVLQSIIAVTVVFQFHPWSVISTLKWEPDGFTSEIVEGGVLL